ncbi:MerR family transcriptional regulator [Caldimonas tepidiphila]|uniref:MerR family transcriptional regulator n=1 Tax=Caldimonas tepidiphila TaxID=2315841 RepID=UPI000E5A12A2|nr:MerR family transcriptional regulator [Caldimonas tepidiphila]
MEKSLPAIPVKRYFTIGEVSELCGVKPYVLRYWEQEFTQLKPMKRRGNRRYYQHHEVLLIRRIRELLYEQGFTISGARNRLAEAGSGARQVAHHPEIDEGDEAEAVSMAPQAGRHEAEGQSSAPGIALAPVPASVVSVLERRPVLASDPKSLREIRQELLSIRILLAP